MKTIKRYGRALILPVIIFCIAALFVWIAVSQAEPVDTYHIGWYLVRAADDEDGATFSAVYDLTGVGTTNGDYDSMSDDAFEIPPGFWSRPGNQSSPGTKWMFAICGKNYNNTDDTFSFDVVGWARSNGMQQKICEGDGVLGTQAVVTYPDGDDALGELCSLTGVTYTHATTTFVDTDDAGGFDGAVAGMLARITGTNITNGIVQVTTVTDANTIICSGATSTDNTTDATVQINPAFWADTINIDSITKWSGALSDPNTDSGYYRMAGNIAVLNSGNDQVALLIIDTMGMDYVQFVFYDCDAATGDESGDLRVYGRPF